MSTICIVQSQRKTGSPNLLISGSSISRYSNKPDAEDHEDFCRVKIMLHHSHLELNDLRGIDGETVSSSIVQLLNGRLLSFEI
jgi:hypothetical protein